MLGAAGDDGGHDPLHLRVAEVLAGEVEGHLPGRTDEAYEGERGRQSIGGGLGS